MEIHPGRGSASKSFNGYFFIVWVIFVRFPAFFCVLVGFCTFLICFSALGALLGALGTLLGALGTLLGRSWGDLGCSWELLGRSWSALGALLGALGTLLGRSWAKIRKKKQKNQFYKAQFGAPNPLKLAKKSFKNRCQKKTLILKRFFTFFASFANLSQKLAP